mgnify:CR=1 FL=1
MPVEGEAFDLIFRDFENIILPGMTHWQHPQFCAYFPSGSSEPSILGEMLATSDLPGGGVNLLTGLRAELVPAFATHTHLRAISGVAGAEERKQIKLAAADSVKRTQLLKAEDARDWFADSAEGLYEIGDLVEFKTTWHPVGS